MAKSREGRFETCGELAAAAASAMGSPVPAQRAVDPVPRAATVTSARRDGRRIRVATVAAVAALAVVGGTMLARSLGTDTDPGTPTPVGDTPVPFSPGAVVIAAAGEIACNAEPYVPGDADHCQYDDTSRLLQRDELTAVLALGDNQYETGTFNEYFSYYDRWWGKVRTITEPVPGDHEYNGNPNSHAHGYFAYWGAPAEGHDGLRVPELRSAARLHAGNRRVLAHRRAQLRALPAPRRLRTCREGNDSRGGQRDVSMAETRPCDTSERRVRMHAGLLAPSAVLVLVLAGERCHAGGRAALGRCSTPAVPTSSSTRTRTTISGGSHRTPRVCRTRPAGSASSSSGRVASRRTRSHPTCGRPDSRPRRTPRSASSRSSCRQRDSPGSGCRPGAAGVQRQPDGTGGVSLMPGDSRVGTGDRRSSGGVGDRARGDVRRLPGRAPAPPAPGGAEDPRSRARRG